MTKCLVGSMALPHPCLEMDQGSSFAHCLLHKCTSKSIAEHTLTTFLTERAPSQEQISSLHLKSFFSSDTHQNMKTSDSDM